MRDFTSKLTIMLSGRGITTKKNFVDNLEDWIYGKDAESRDFKILWVHDNELTESDLVIQEWTENIQLGDGLVEYAPVGDEDYITTHNRAVDELFFDSFGLEKAYISLYDPLQDLEGVTKAKEVSQGEEFVTLNMDGLIDSFEGYETPELKAAREALEAEQKAQKPARAPRKKAVAPKVAKPLQAAEKPLTAPSIPILEPVVEYQLGDTLTVAGIKFTKHSDLPSVDDIEQQWAELTQEQVSSVRDSSLSPQMHRMAKDILTMGNNIVAMGETLSSMLENFKALLDTDV